MMLKRWTTLEKTVLFGDFSISEIMTMLIKLMMRQEKGISNNGWAEEGRGFGLKPFKKDDVISEQHLMYFLPQKNIFGKLHRHSSA